MNSANDHNLAGLYKAHHRSVYNVALDLLQSKEDAEEIVQDVFLEAHRSLAKFDGRSAVSTWLYRIAVNKSLDLLRSRKRQKRFAFFTGLFHSSGEPLQEIPHFDHPGAALEQKEDTQLLFKALNELPERQKTAFVLSQIEKLPQKEIALILGLSEKAVESLVQRAKSGLREKLGKFYPGRRK